MSNYLFPPKAQVYPFSNVDQQLANPFAVNNPIGFSSNESPSRFGLPEPQSNIQAANSYIAGVTKGGGNISTNRSQRRSGGRRHKSLRHKIKNIVFQYILL